MEFKSKFGLGEIVIRETHKNGELVQERMMEVVGIGFEKHEGRIRATYACEDTANGHRQAYTEDMLVGDPDFNQDLGGYPVEPKLTNRDVTCSDTDLPVPVKDGWE